MNYVKIPKGNALQFWELNSQAKSDYFLRLPQNVTYKNYFYKETPMMFFVNDTINMQVWSNIDVNFKVYDYNNNEVGVSGSVEVATIINDATFGDVLVYNVKINLVGLKGYFYIKFEFGENEVFYQSAFFEVISDLSNKVEISWINEGVHGVFGDFDYKFYLSARNVRIKPTQEKNISKSYKGDVTTLSGTAGITMTLEIHAISVWICEVLNLASLNPIFKINGVSYVNEAGLNFELIASDNDVTNLYSGVLEFTKKDYLKEVEVVNIEPVVGYNIIVTDWNNGDLDTYFVIVKDNEEFCSLVYKD